MSTEFVRRFSSLFTDSPQTNMAVTPHHKEQSWTSRIDVDSMIASMANKNPNVKPPHVQLIKQLISSISNVTRDHPVYPVMIRKAIGRLNEGKGCSKDEISEFIVKEYDVSPVVNVARVVVELDRLVKGREIVLTAENRYLARVDEDEDENVSGSIRDMGRKRGRCGGGRGWRGSKVRKVVEENVVVEEGDNQNVGNEGEDEGLEARTDGISEEESEKEELPPGFEGGIVRNEEREKVVGCREIERIEILQGDGGRDELLSGKGIDEECVQGAGDGGDVEMVVGMREPGVNEGSRELQGSLEAECGNEATALVILPSKEVEGKDPTAPVDRALIAKTLEIVSCSRPLEVESVGKQSKLQEKHDRVLNMIGDLSDTAAKLREENLQSNEDGSEKHMFAEEHYVELLKKTEAIQLALKFVIDKVKAVDVSNHTGTEVVAVLDSVSGTASESEISKETRRGKRKRKTKHRKRTREVDTLLKSRPEQEASASIQSEQLKGPRKIKFIPPRPPLQQNEPSERQIVCGLEIQEQRKGSTGIVVAKGLKSRRACIKYDLESSIEVPRSKRPRTKGPNVKESTQARKQEVKITVKELKLNRPTAGDCTQMYQQPLGQDSSQPEVTTVGVLAEPLPSQHDNELQDHGKALPIKLAVEDDTGRIIYLHDPRKEKRSQIQGQRGHKELDDKKQVEGSNESIPKLKPSAGVTDNSSLDLEHQSNEQGKQPQVQDQISNQKEKMAKLQSDVAKQQKHDGQHQGEGIHEGIPKLKPNAGVTDNSSQDLEHQSNEQGKPPQVEDKVSNQPEEMLKLQSDVSKQQNHDDQQQAEISHESIPKLKLSSGVTDNSLLHSEHQYNEPGKPPQQVEDQISNKPEEMLKLQSDASNQQEQLQHVQGEGSEQHQCQGSEGQVSSQQEQQLQEQLVESHGDDQHIEQTPAQPQTSDAQQRGQGSKEQEELEVEAEQSPSVSEPAKSAALTTPSSHKHEEQSVEGQGRLTRSKASAAAAAAAGPSPSSSSPHQKQQSAGSPDEHHPREQQGRHSSTSKGTAARKLHGSI